MTPRHAVGDPALQETAALFSLGMLDSEATLEFSRHLETCPACSVEVRAFDETAAQMCLEVPSIAPPPELRTRVLDSIFPPPEYVVKRGSDGAWLPFGVPGIQMKPLSEDPSTGTRTFLLKLNPGATLPPHNHADAEHCFVVEGEVFDHEHSLRAGDYELRLAGSKHAAVSTKTGAVVLIITSHHDEEHS